MLLRTRTEKKMTSFKTQGVDKISGKTKVRRYNFRVDETLYQATKVFLHKTFQIGKLSDILRKLLFNYILTEEGEKFMTNPLWEKQQAAFIKESELKRSLGVVDSLEAELARLLTNENDVNAEISTENLMKADKEKYELHPKMPVFIRTTGNLLWTCRICEREQPSTRGLHLHKCWKDFQMNDTERKLLSESLEDVENLNQKSF